MNSIQAIQMIGTQRSGSNLLRLLLNQYSQIAAPHPPHILQRFFPLLPAYGDLSDPKNMYLLIDDVCVMIEKNPVPWTGIVLDRQKIMDQCEIPHLTEIFRIVYDELAVCHKASMWLCKSMVNMYYSDIMERNGIKPIYIFLHRDGRDVACSFKKAIVGEKHVFHIAKKWREDQEACLKLKENVEGKRFFQMNYEDLILSPEPEMQRLSQFLIIPYDPSIFDYYQSEESKSTSTAGKMWENVAKPIFSNSKKYLKELSQDEILIFEIVAGDTLEKLGYSLEFPEESKKRILTKAEIALFGEENNLLKKESALKADPEGMKLRKGQDEHIQNIKSRT